MSAMERYVPKDEVKRRWDEIKEMNEMALEAGEERRVLDEKGGCGGSQTGGRGASSSSYKRRVKRGRRRTDP